jgi:hypothetical protein
MEQGFRPRLPDRISGWSSVKPQPFWTEESLGWFRTTHPVREGHESDPLTASGLRNELGVSVHALRADARFRHSMTGSWRCESGAVTGARATAANAARSSPDIGVNHGDHRKARSYAQSRCASPVARCPHLVHASIHQLASSMRTWVCATVRTGVGTDAHRIARGPSESAVQMRVRSSALPSVRQSAHANAGLVYTGCAHAARLVSAKTLNC